MLLHRVLPVMFLFFTMIIGIHGQDAKTSLSLPDGYVAGMNWRSIGPANMSGRIPAIAVYQKDPSTWWAASASGGLLKTTNNGITFEHQFDDQATVSIGDVQVSQSNPNLVWVGTGEANPRNSVSWGDGVYKSTDGGKTWTNMGLKKTFQIGRIAINPEDNKIVYVGALGRLWGPNPERGLFKTSDGGKTWNKILFINDKTGVIDVQMDPGNPNRLYVATYERKRDGFDGNDPEVKYGDNAAIYRTDDGGKTFKRLEKGLPTCKLGRIGLSIYQKDSKYVYAIVESEKIGQMPGDLAFAGLTGEAATDVGVKITAITKDGPAAKAGLKVNDIVISANDNILHTYDDFLKIIRNSAAETKLKLTCSREKKTVDIALTMGVRPKPTPEDPKNTEGKQATKGKNRPQNRRQSTRTEFTGTLGGQAANRQDFQGTNGHDYGGIYMSNNYGDSWVRINSLNPRPMYYSQIRVDPSNNQYIYVCGTQLYKSKDGGTTFTNDGGSDGIHVDHHSLWIDPNDGRHMILGNDGGIHVTYDRMTHWDHLAHVAIGQFYHVGISHDLDYFVYGGLQDNGSWGGPSRSPNGGAINSDWVRVGGGDGFICLVDPNDPNQIYTESQNGSMGRTNLKTGERGFIRPRAPQGVTYRFNWKTPFILSPHNPKIHYSAGNFVFRSPFKGDKIKPISPEITNTDKGAGSAISESAVEEGVLYVGTTDGGLWATRDGGQNWFNLYTESDKINANTKTPETADTNGESRGGGRGRGGRGSMGGSRFRESLLQRDSNKDGKISKDEVPEQMQRIFDRLDANKDDVIDKKELEALGTGQPSDQTPNDPAPDKKNKDEKNKDESKQKETTEKTDEKKTASSDPVAGEWTGRFVNSDFPGEFTLTLERKGESITGLYSSARADGKITSGKLDGNNITLTGETGAELKFSGKISGNRMTGSLDVNNGQFTVDFEATRKASGAGSEAKPAVEGKPIQELVPGPRWVSSIESSKFKAGRCYMTLDGHRSNDDQPYLFRTENYGQTWTSIQANLPTTVGSTRVIREDVENENLLFLGCEFSCWVSIDRGLSWTKLNTNLPTVAIHELAIHPTRGEVVAATHGRSLWILNISGLRQLSKDSLAAAATLYRPSEMINWQRGQSRGTSGTRRFVGENPSSSLPIYYSLGKDAKSVKLAISNIEGTVVYSADGIPGERPENTTGVVIESGTKKGLHVLEWNGSSQSSNQSRQRNSRSRRGGRRVPNGQYLVTLTVDGTISTQKLSIIADPTVPPSATSEEELEFNKAMNGLAEEDELEQKKNQVIFD